MNAIDQLPSSVTTMPHANPAGKLCVDAPATSTATPLEHGSSTRVTLSQNAVQISRDRSDVRDGYTTMLARIFHVDDRKNEPKVETRATMANMIRGDQYFLTHQDRAFLAYAYQYAQEQGLASDEVDALAFDLGGFRFREATGNNIEVLPGSRWSIDGTPEYWRMTTADSDIATRILISSAAASSPLDHSFIAYMLNPRGAGWRSEDNVGHACNFAFLEKLINASGTHTLLKVDPEHPEPLYQNSLYWIRHQDIPDLAPPAREVDTTSTGIDSAMFRDQLHANSESSPDYVAQAMALRKLHQDAPKPGTRAEKKASYRARTLERQQTVSSLLRDFISARLGSFWRRP